MPRSRALHLLLVVAHVGAFLLHDELLHAAVLSVDVVVTIADIILDYRRPRSMP